MKTHDDFGGFRRDLVFGRRRALGLFAGAGAAGVLAACSSGENTSTSSAAPGTSTMNSAGASAPGSTVGTTAGTTAGSATPATTAATTPAAASSTPTETTAATTIEASPGEEIPDETAGPFPADGTNGPNVLTTSGVERADLTTSFGDLSGVADGIPIRFDLHVVDAATGAPLPGAAVYLWHCTAGGRYSLYEIDDQNYLRGLQSANSAGVVTFASVFPGCYQGRWPHAHFEVFESTAGASTGDAAVKSSQLALPEASCLAVYGDARYGESTSNLGRLSLDSDGVFRDGWTEQLATVTGSNSDGYVASLLVRV